MMIVRIFCYILAGSGALAGAATMMTGIVLAIKAQMSCTHRGNVEENKKRFKPAYKKGLKLAYIGFTIVVISALILLPFIPK